MKSGRPWEIDIADLLEMFIVSILRTRDTDLRLCGSVALSSALLYRFKVETIFYFERLRAERTQRSREEPPRIIVLPFRYELYSTSIDDLVASLEAILNDVVSRGAKQREMARKVEPEPQIETDQYIIKIGEMVRDFRSKLLSVLMRSGDTLFSELVEGLSIFEKVRTFILLLFVATEGIVRLSQDGDDIRIVRVVYV